MINEKPKQCKSKGCCNPVLDGKYCEYCKQIRQETKNKILVVAGGAAVPAVGFAIKKGALKQVPKIAAKVIKVILKR
jgi:hypothetical protein